MKALDTELQSGGFHYRQIGRQGDWAVYEQSKGQRVISYELVHIQRRAAEKIRGRDYPERETYPCSESWGTEAWTIVDRQEALRRLHLVAEFEVRKDSETELQALQG